MKTKRIEPEVMQEMLRAAEGMGVMEGKQDFRSTGAIEFHVVDFFDTFFGEWGFQGRHLLVHLFPRAGKEDVWYESRYVNHGRSYVPGRREFCPQGLSFPPDMEEIVKEASGLVTFGDVELDFVKELQAWAIRFCDAEPFEPWIEGGLLENFFIAVDRKLDPEQ